MTPEMIRALPPWGIAAGLIGVVIVGVLIGYGLLALLGSLAAKPAPADGPTLADEAESLLRARRGVGRFDARFDRLIDGTRLGITGETAIGWILLLAAV